MRAHPDPDFRIQTGVIELKDQGEIYLVAPQLWHSLALEATFGPRLLVLSVTRGNVPFLWPVRLPGTGGRVDTWNRSALEAVQVAQERWVRVVANMALGGYEVLTATASIPEPEWPELTFGQILKIAFHDRIVETVDHPVLRQLRGEA